MSAPKTALFATLAAFLLAGTAATAQQAEPVLVKPPLGVVSPYKWTPPTETLLLSNRSFLHQGELQFASDVNARIEFMGGAFDLPDEETYFRGAGSVGTAGQGFGGQFDGSISKSPPGVSFGGTAHAFYREPDSYAAGVTAGIARSRKAVCDLNPADDRVVESR